MKRFLYCLFLITLFIIVFCVYVYYKSSISDYKPTIISNFEENIKEHLKSPSSYKFISASCYNDEDKVIFVIEYEASNSFGAMIKNSAIYKLRAFDYGRGDFYGEKDQIRLKAIHDKIHTYKPNEGIPIEEFYIVNTSFDVDGEFSIFNKRGRAIGGVVDFRSGKIKNAIYTGHNIKYKCGDGKQCNYRYFKLVDSGFYRFERFNNVDKMKIVIKNMFNIDL